MRLALALGAVLALAACTQTVELPTVTRIRGATSGQIQPIDYFYYVNSDCSSAGDAQIRVVEPPANGALITERGRQPIAFVASNARSVCNGEMTPATFIRYRSNPGYTGGDKVEIEVIGPYGAATLIQYNVSVHPPS